MIQKSGQGDAKECEDTGSSVDSRQVGGDHYRSPIQHWNFVIANNIPYLEAQIIKYVMRWRKKNGLQDLEKAQHFLEKLINEAVTTSNVEAGMKVGAVERIAPTGWIGFTFEAHKEGKDIFTCKKCGAKTSILPQVDPGMYHSCAGRNYVNQD